MGKRLRIILIFISISVCLCFMSNTYSRYVADTTGDIDMLFAKWQILVNEKDIADEANKNITITPTIEQNSNVKKDTVAPSSKGYFDIEVDPTNVDVSFDYSINISIVNKDIPDILISKYSIIDNNYKDGDSLTTNTLESNQINGNLTYDNKTANFKYEPFTVRVYFEWYDGENEKMNDEDDTKVGENASENSFKINASIKFSQSV